MSTEIGALANAVLEGDRASLARAITLIESGHSEHRVYAGELIERLQPKSGNSFRLGVSGVPGVGKSTFLDAFGSLLIERGHKIAILAIDPSSGRTGGSILADKTRMERLSSNANAYIRPTPSRGELGGVARSTHDAIMVVEAAGFDIVIVETVGVGQSEILVADLVDLCLVLMLPGAGDDYQGIKKGILEVADIFAVTKADGALEAEAIEAKRTLDAVCRLLRPSPSGWKPPVHLVSALQGRGLDVLWDDCLRFCDHMKGSNAFHSRRAMQRVAAFNRSFEWQLQHLLSREVCLQDDIDATRNAVASGTITPSAACDHLIGRLRQVLHRGGSS